MQINNDIRPSVFTSDTHLLFCNLYLYAKRLFNGLVKDTPI